MPSPKDTVTVSPDLLDATIEFVPGRGRKRLSYWLATPLDRDDDQPPLVAIHGLKRGARAQAMQFLSAASATGRVVIAPVFEAGRWPRYQQVVHKGRADLALLNLLADLRAQRLYATDRIDISGYSAGAQFAHRFAMLYPHLIRRLSLTAAGWYTFPDSAPYPYGFGPGNGRRTDWSAAMSSGFREFVGLDIRVFVGTRDNVVDPDTRSGPAIDGQQGRTRLERARRWVEAVRRAAAKHSVIAGISLTELPGCGHSFSECITKGDLDRRVFADHPREQTGATSPRSGQKSELPNGCRSICMQEFARAKWAFTTRRVDREDVALLSHDLAGARAGDLVLGRVQRIGSHKKIQLRSGRGSQLYTNDLVVLACGARYAPDQFEGVALLRQDGADMLAGGGVLGLMRSRNGRMTPPTRILPLGLLANRAGRVCNTANYAVAPAPRDRRITVIGVVGTSMNSGKTTAVASLVRGLSRAGHRVAAIKATGTGAYGDYNAYLDAGASHVADFVDAGMVSTYLEPVERIGAGTEDLISHACADGCTVAIVELADGVLQQETAALLGCDVFREGFAGFLFAAPDALAAVGGVRTLHGFGITPAAITGVLSQSPLGSDEARAATGIPVLRRDDLMDPARSGALLRTIRQHGTAAQDKGHANAVAA